MGVQTYHGTMKHLLGILLLSLSGADIARATILTTNQIITWQPGVGGLAGAGIPVYPQGINVKNPPYSAVGDGVTDDHAAIVAAIAAETNGNAIYFPPGTYKIGTNFTINTKSIVLRGAGATSTALLLTSSTASEGIRLTGSGSTENNASSGYTRDSTNIVMSSTAGFSANDYAFISQDNDTNYMEGNIPSPTGRYQAQMFRILSVTSTNITISRPLYYSYYTNTLNVTVRKIDPILNAGLEDMKIVATNSSINAIVQFLYAVGCWVKSVESECSMGTPATHIDLALSYQCEVRDSYFHHGQFTGSTPYGISVNNRSSDNLIENNIFYYLRHAILFQNGANGNVAGYNFTARMFSDDYPLTDYLMPSIECHGGEPNWNLIEGNIGTELMADNFWGSSHYNTFFRNWSWRHSDGESNPITVARFAFRIDAQNLYENVVANWVGLTGQTNGGSNNANYMFGDNWNSLDPTTAADDPRTTNTMVLHGNYQFIEASYQWDGSIADHSPVTSYYRVTQPSFMNGFNWPPIGVGVSISGITTNSIVLPAQSRFMGIGPSVPSLQTRRRKHL